MVIKRTLLIFDIMQKTYFLHCFFVFICCFSSKGQTLKINEINNNVKLNFIPITMPTDDFPKLKPIMGLAGLHYQIPINKWIYVGTGMHFALTGDQGGLFALGVEMGINKQIYKDLFFDANIHFGGGGGYRNLVNDGGFVNTNIGLQYQKENYSFGVHYSHINFYSGKIKDNTISFSVAIPNVLNFADYKESYKQFTALNTSEEIWKKKTIKNTQQLRFDFLYPIGKSKKDNGEVITETLYVLGFEYQKYFYENVFLFAHTDAIYKGLRAGFMDLFLGLGYHPYQSEYINVFGKLGVGASGGRIAPEGGLTVYPSAGIDIKIFKNIAISGYGGYYRAVCGDFEAYTMGIGVKYWGISGGAKNSEKENTLIYTQGLRVELQNQSYFDIAKTDDIYNAKFINLQNIGLKVNYDVFKRFYISGEASFTYKGRSGGYAHGMIGVGAYSSKFLGKKVRGFLEIMAGAGGGAGVSTGEGIIIRPALGLNYNITNKIDFVISGGRYIAPFGKVASTNLNIGLSFNFSTINLYRFE